MRKVNRSALVPYTAREMFRLVDDIASYPEFLPWCNAATVQQRDPDKVVATLELRKGAVSRQFTTRNTPTEYSSIDIALVGGPFRRLSGGWRFREIGNTGCEVGLELEFAFASMLVDMMFGNFFE
ncbi:MAG TPA: type II toxin-antitoxin system RatA family toxin, partial [Woeseiaceae bacterium]|nr:type II toxin-antitoxin system RatA family toxin [Woeseiaceae bacterium]